MVPDSEFSEPTLMVGPLVSTHDAAVELLASLTDVPHADRPKAAAVSTAF